MTLQCVAMFFSSRSFTPNRPLLAGLVGVMLAASVAAQEWPQWGGPDRNFTLPARALATSWPDGGPPREWAQRLGPGHSGIVVSGGTLYTSYRDGQKEVLVAHHAASGGFKWRHELPAKLWKGFNPQFGSGPHSTPLVSDGRIFVVSVRALVVCLRASDGEVIWSHDLWQQHQAEPTDRGYASSPLAYSGTVIVPAAGRGLVALDAASGEVRWKNLELPNNAFSSPIIAEIGGRDQLIAFLGAEVAGVDPENGRVLWRHPHRTEYNINAMTPLVGEDGLVFVSSAYDGGSRALQVVAGAGDATVEELWHDRRLQIHHGTAVRIGETIIGSSGDFGPAFLMGVDARTGEVRFKTRGFAKANVLRVGDALLILDEDGVLALAGLSGDDLVIRARAQILSPRSWTAPTLVGTTLFLRDQKEIVALDLGLHAP